MADADPGPGRTSEDEGLLRDECGAALDDDAVAVHTVGEAEEAVQQRSLAAARRADHRDELTAVRREVHGREHRRQAGAPRDVADEAHGDGAAGRRRRRRQLVLLRARQELLQRQAVRQQPACASVASHSPCFL